VPGVNDRTASSRERLRIAFLISALPAGGAERVAVTLCNTWSRNGHEVSLLTYLRPDEPSHYPIDAEVTYYPLSAMAKSRSLPGRAINLIGRVWRIRRCLRMLRADVLVCFMTEVNVVGVVAAAGSGLPVVISERIHPGSHPVGRVLAWCRAKIYPHADMIVVQTADIAQWYREVLGLDTRVIGNPVPEGFAAASPRRPVLMAAGRLERQKGFDLLIDAFADLASEFPDWDLVIYGEGSERAALETRAAPMGARVRLPGVVPDLPARLCEVEIFVHPARYEGFPNALCEALAAGCCVVASDCPGATREILADGRYGVLVPTEDADALALALRRVMSDAARRGAFAMRAREAVAPFALEQVAETWIAAFRACLDARNKV